MKREKKEIRYSRQILAFRQILERFHFDESLQRILVLGCGDGLEAAYLSRLLECEVYGVDINQEFHPFGWMNATLSNYDGRHLPFSQGYFDAIYSYHVLEHVQDVSNTLNEIRRVLRPHGFVYIGVPNKLRLFGYLGMNDKSIYVRLRQNIIDWRKRLYGEWDNSLGAHAGFAQDELAGLMANFFASVVPVSHFYYAAKWPRWRFILELLTKLSLDKIVLPSIYLLASQAAGRA